MMKLILRVGLAVTLQLLLIHPASAQWQGGIGLSARGLTNSEYDRAGRTLVREQGWLPGIASSASYQAGNLTWFASVDGYRSTIDYRGQTQSGVGTRSTTSTQLAQTGIGGAYAAGSGFSILAALELDWWKRDIHGTGTAAGLQEVYRSNRLITGVDKAWALAAGTVGASAAVVISEPERLHVRFSGLYDSVSLNTRRAYGIRIGARIRPVSVPHLEFRSGFDWIRVPRSDDAPVVSNGQFVGTVAQPEHARLALTWTVAYIL